MATENQKLKKKQKLRNNEYYNAQIIFDNLYKKSQENYCFKNLMEIITGEQNILLAYRNIKKNKGSKTSGTNNNNIVGIGKTDPNKLVEYVRNRLNNFCPHSVRRVEIEKEGGGVRPLGIPTIEDRLIQQCIKQILEPICEAKFYKHSYGFRPNRSTHHAIARVESLTNRHNFQYVIDIDIKGFLDNVNHAKLLKQMWTMGIQDKNLLCVISKMLKAEIRGIGIPTKGVPQGGILSPLLSNIVLNELDWWIANQWENIPTRHKYSNNSKKHRALKTTRLKEVFIVRYADDFKLFCKTRDSANKLFIATKNWLLERLGLEISPEKSKIVDLKKDYSEFLGMKSKWYEKGDKFVVKSYLTDKAINKCKRKLKEKIKNMQKHPTADNANNFNATVLGMHNYYRVATGVCVNFSRIAYDVNRNLKSRTKKLQSKEGHKSEVFKVYYGKWKGKIIHVAGICLFPIGYIQTRAPLGFSQEACNYTENGRQKLHEKLKGIDNKILIRLMESYANGKSTEFNDNKISLYVGQQGKCYISGESLKISEMEVHHKKERGKGGKDSYDNLVYVTSNIHKLIHATKLETIEHYQKFMPEDKNTYKKLNKLRVLVGNCEINTNK